MVAERKLQRLGSTPVLHPEPCPRADWAASPFVFPFFGPEHDQGGWQLHDHIVGWVATNVA